MVNVMTEKDYVVVLDHKVKEFVSEFKNGYTNNTLTNRVTLKNMLNSMLNTINKLDEFYQYNG